ncbi:IS630 family transposase [Shewanella basaltis]|uniref:IS630 family transposase n=1 Tax=Shewanella basaltis TaxID=472183 RepID=UPI003AAB7C8B
MKQHTSFELIRLSKQTADARMRLRLLAVAHFLDGANRTQVAAMTKISRRIVNQWISNYLSQGLSGLESKKSSGRPPRLTDEQAKQLTLMLTEAAKSETGGRLTGQDIQGYILSEFGISFHLNHVYKILRKLGFSWLYSRSKHPKQNVEVMEAFKKFPLSTIVDIPIFVSPAEIDIWFQDEARIGQQNTTSKLWAEKGTRPLAVRQRQFEYVHLFGAVCPRNGATEAFISPYINKEVMRQHLSQISLATPSGRYAVVIMDGASWHANDIADDFENLSVVKLPPYSPELNPIEQVWSWLRQHKLANRCFEGYESIVDACCEAWSAFIEDKERVKKLCHQQ